MKKRIIALLLLLSLMLQAAPVFAGAAATATVRANTLTINPGASGRITISAENFGGVASLDLYIGYDSDVFTITSYTCGSMLNSAQTSVNTGEAGTVKLSTMALDGLTGSGVVLYLYFTVSKNATAGDYPITVAVGDAYDTMLAPVSISGSNGAVTVNPPTQQAETFRLYGYTGSNSATMGDELTYRLCNSYSLSFVSADFTISYDPDIFQVQEVRIRSELATQNAIYSINSADAGQVRITYASTEPVNSYFMLELDFKVIANVSTSTTINAAIANVYQEDLTAYAPSSRSTTIYLEKTPEVVDHPDIWLESQPLIVGQTSNAILTLEQGAGVAAADFTITYDPAVVRCAAVTAAEEVASLGGMIVINENFTNGEILFSYINMGAYDDTDIPLIQITWESLVSPAEHYQALITGQGVVDPEQGSVTLEYVTATDCIYEMTVVAADCTMGGSTTYTCGCGESYQKDLTEALGHSHETDPMKCDRCGYEKSVVSIDFHTMPDTLLFFGKRDQLDVSGGVLDVTLEDGVVIQIPMEPQMVSGFDNTVPGVQVLTVSYGGVTTIYQIEITTATVEFRNWDGTLLSTGEYMYGETPIQPEVPERPSIP